MTDPMIPFREVRMKAMTDMAAEIDRLRQDKAQSSRIIKQCLKSAKRLHENGFIDDEQMQAFIDIMREDAEVLRELAKR
jgi:hypothetical protein